MGIFAFLLVGEDYVFLNRLSFNKEWRLLDQFLIGTERGEGQGKSGT